MTTESDIIECVVHTNYGYAYSINAFLKSKDYVFWKLKYK
jgi:hypothetical protein